MLVGKEWREQGGQGRSAAPDLAHNGSLAPALAEVLEDPPVQHELPDGSVAPRLHHGCQGLWQQPLPILGAHHGHHGLFKQPAGTQETSMHTLYAQLCFALIRHLLQHALAERLHLLLAYLKAVLAA